MSQTALVFGKVSSYFTFSISKTIKKYFPQKKQILYLHGHPKNEINQLKSLKVDELYYDYNISKNRPPDPDMHYLRKTENSKKINSLWRCVEIDRMLIKQGRLGLYHEPNTLYSKKDLLSHLEARVRVIESLFDNNNISFVYGQQIMRLGGMCIVKFAEASNTKFFRAGTTRVSNLFTVFESVFEESIQVLNAFQAAKKDPFILKTFKQAESHIKSVRNGNPPYKIVEDNEDEEVDEKLTPNRYPQFVNHILKKTASFFTNLSDYVNSDYYYQVPVVKRAMKRCQKEFRKSFLENTNYFDYYDPSENYIYFPLQAQPELSLMIWAPDYTDLLSVVIKTAEQIPDNKKLYVTEHPRMLGVRRFGFYSKIKNIENTKIIRPEMPVIDLVKNSDAVTCISSSVGFQSVITGTPTSVLGKPGYAQMDTVYEANSFDDLHDWYRMDKDVDMKEVKSFIAANMSIGFKRGSPHFEENVCRYIKRSLQHSEDKAWKLAISSKDID